MTRKTLFRLLGLPVIAAGIYFLWNPLLNPVPTPVGRLSVPQEYNWAISLKRAIAPDARIFAGCCGSWILVSPSGSLQVLDETGAVQTEVPFPPGQIPAFGDGGVLVSENGFVFRVDRTGQTLWKTDLKFSILHPPVQADNGIFLLSTDGKLVRLNRETGAKEWETSETGRSEGGFVLIDGRTLAYGNCNSAVYLVNARDGRSEGEIALGEGAQTAGSPAYGFSALYLGIRSGEILRIGIAEKKVLGRMKISETEAFAPIANAGLVFATGTTEGTAVLFDPDFKRQRQLTLPGGSPVTQVFVRPGSSDVWYVSGSTLFRIDTASVLIKDRFALGDKLSTFVFSGDRLACIADDNLIVLKRSAGEQH